MSTSRTKSIFIEEAREVAVGEVVVVGVVTQMAEEVVVLVGEVGPTKTGAISTMITTIQETTTTTGEVAEGVAAVVGTTTINHRQDKATTTKQMPGLSMSHNKVQNDIVCAWG